MYRSNLYANKKAAEGCPEDPGVVPAEVLEWMEAEATEYRGLPR